MKVFGEDYFAFCPKCGKENVVIHAASREDAVKEWNEANKEEANADNDK